MKAHLPSVGDWYSIRGELFEVVALDESDGTLEVQYFDGTIEEMEIADWETQYAAGEIEDAEAPEDWSGSVDVESDENIRGNSDVYDERRLRAAGNDDVGLFD